jgi:hypothetical protein
MKTNRPATVVKANHKDFGGCTDVVAASAMSDVNGTMTPTRAVSANAIRGRASARALALPSTPACFVSSTMTRLLHDALYV